MNSIIAPQELVKILNERNLVILDASITADVPTLQIKGALFFDIKNSFSDAYGKFPNTIPSAEQFQEEAQNLGIGCNSKIVIYDNRGIYSAPRAWWLFRTFGHDNVLVLDGGLPEWMAKGYPTEERTVPNHKKGNFKAYFNQNKVRYFTDIKNNVKTKKELVVDARSSGRFSGIEPEPRKGLRSGYIPNSVNIPYTEVLCNGKFKSRQELKSIFESRIKEKRPLVFSCGSGITACIILLASNIIGKKDVAVYDGSWTEWVQMEAK